MINEPSNTPNGRGFQDSHPVDLPIRFLTNRSGLPGFEAITQTAQSPFIVELNTIVVQRNRPLLVISYHAVVHLAILLRPNKKGDGAQARECF